MIYFIGNLEIEKSNVYEVSTIEFCINYFKDKKYIQLDIETELNLRNPKSLPNPYEQKIICFQLGDKYNQFVVDAGLYSLSLFKELLEDKNRVKIFTNGFFDLRFLYHFGIELSNLWDCFLVERILTRGIKHPKGYLGLSQLCKRYCNIELSKEIRSEISLRGLDTQVIKYSASDVTYMEDIMQKQLKRAEELELTNYINLEHLFLPILSKVSYNGFKIDVNSWRGISENNKVLLSKFINKLNTWLVDNKYEEYLSNQLEIFNSGKSCNLNWDSSKQVIKLFKKIGINTQVRDKDKGGFKDSVEGKHLIRQKNKFPILADYLKYKEISKELSTYGESFINKNLNPVSGRVHSEFFQILDTGRISSSNPNLQNITATDDNGEINPLRKCFISEKENILVICDYSQQEPRITADKCQDSRLLDFIFNGDGDSHSLTSTAISEYLLGEEIKVSKKNNPLVIKYNQKIRDIGKTLGLGLDYGKTAFSVKDDLDIKQEEAQKLIDILKSKFPQKEEYFKLRADFVKYFGYIITDEISGAKTWFNEYSAFRELSEISYEVKSKSEISKYYKLKGQIERFAANYPIQGTAGMMTKYACILFDREIKVLNLNAFIVNLIHDEIVVECKKEESKLISDILVKAMIDAGKKFCKTVPMKVEPIISEYWKK